MAKRLEIQYTVLERMDMNAFVNASLEAMQRQGFPLPNVHQMRNPARDVAIHIRDVLKLPNCHIIHFEGSVPPTAAAIFFDGKVFKKSS